MLKPLGLRHPLWIKHTIAPVIVIESAGSYENAHGFKD